MTSANPKNESAGLAGTLAKAFVNSKLTPLLIISSVLLGLMAIVLLPREEEPQIRVPIADILMTMEGATAEEVESRVSAPLERLLWEIPGVEYVYTTSMPGRSMAVVRFRVGEDVERSMVKLTQKLGANYDRIPSGVSPPLIKLRSIDDVPILALTLHSSHYDELTLRRLAAEVAAHVKRIPLRRPEPDPVGVHGVLSGHARLRPSRAQGRRRSLFRPPGPLIPRHSPIPSEESP